MFRHLLKLTRFVRHHEVCKRVVTRRSILGGLLLSSVHVKAEVIADSDKYEVDKDELSVGKITKMAAVQTVNSATTLLTHSVTVLLDVLETYVELLHTLVQLMEMHISVYGEKYREDKVWDAMMEVRKRVNECKEQKEQLETVYHCAEQALQAAGEAAHITGAEYAGIAANERVYSATMQLRNKQYSVEEAEAKLRQMEVRSIEEISKKTEQETGQSAGDGVPSEEESSQEYRTDDRMSTDEGKHFYENNDMKDDAQFYSTDDNNDEDNNINVDNSDIKVTIDGREYEDYPGDQKSTIEVDDEEMLYKY